MGLASSRARAFLADRKVQAVALGVACALLVLTFVEAEATAHRAIGNDFTGYLAASRALLEGGNPYQTESPFRYVYPLFPALLLIPLTFLPLWLAVAIWFLGNVAALAFAALASVELALPARRGAARSSSSPDFLTTPLCLAFFLMFGIIQNNLRNGQMNLVLLALCLLFYRSLLAGATGRAALFLAAAIATKVAPVYLLVLLLRRRSWKVLSLTAPLAVALCLLPALLLGSRTFELYGWYLRSLLFPTAGAAISWTGTFFTLHGFLAYLRPSWDGLALHLVATTAVLGAAITVDRRARSETVPANAFWVLALYLCTILLLTPWSQKHHLVLLVPPVALAVVGTLAGRPALRPRHHALLGAFFVLLYLGKLAAGAPFYFLSVVAMVALIASIIEDNAATQAPLAGR